MNTLTGQYRDIDFDVIIDIEPTAKVTGMYMNNDDSPNYDYLTHTPIKKFIRETPIEYHNYLNTNDSYFDYNKVARLLGISIGSLPERLQCFSYKKRKNETNAFSVFLYFCGNQGRTPLTDKKGYMSIYSSYIPIIVERTSNSRRELNIINVVYIGKVSCITTIKKYWNNRIYYECRSRDIITGDNQLGLTVENIIENSRDSIIENDRLLYRIMFNEELPIDSQ